MQILKGFFAERWFILCYLWRLKKIFIGWTVGGFEEDAGSVDPETGVSMLARYAMQIGVKIYTNCAVRGIETAAGKISDVVTEKGSIKTSSVVLAPEMSSGGLDSLLECPEPPCGAQVVRKYK